MSNKIEYTTELSSDMIDLIEYHLPNRSRDTITWYENFSQETVLYYKDGKLDGMISYFFLDFPFDTIIVMQRDNVFYKSMWRILKETISKRVKPLRIMSDPNNKVLVRGAERHGGKWHEDEIWFK
jgi:hypothetical protein